MRREVIRILARVGDLEDGSKVTKRTGEKIYIVRRSITIYDGKDSQKIECKGGAVFLVDSNGNANVYDYGTTVLWSASVSDVFRYIDPEEDK